MVSCVFLELTVLWSETSDSCLLRAVKHSRSAVILVGILIYPHIDLRELMPSDRLIHQRFPFLHGCTG